jgi:UDP:flavonoid glycosyltransferase YjiC (YdhE family)
VALLRGADLTLHHGGNNSVQEALAAGVRQIVLPFSTDQFSSAADLERTGTAVVLSPNTTTVADLVDAITASLPMPAPLPAAPPTAGQLVRAMFD